MEIQFFRIGPGVPGPGFRPVETAGSVVLWRVVDARELKAIRAAGGRYTLGTGNEGKYFYPTKAQAKALAQKYERLGLGKQTITRAEVDEGVFTDGGVDSIAIAGEGDAWYFLEGAVAEVGEVAILE